MAKTFNRYLGGKSGGAAANIYVTGLSQDDLVTMRTPSRVAQGVWSEIPNSIAHGLPEGYTELEYIESSGSQSIKLPVSPTSNVGYEIDAMRLGGTYSQLLGTRISTSITADGIWVWVQNSTTEAPNFIYGGESYRPTIFKGQVRFHAKLLNKVLAIKANGMTETHTFTSTQTAHNSPFTIAALCTNGNPTEKTAARFWRVVVYDGETPVCECIPCKRNSDNKVSMYDLVSGTFLEPNGTFTGGEVIPTTIPCFKFLADEYGMHTITATNGSKTSTEEVLVDALMDYWVEMDYKLWLYKYGDERETVTGGIFLASGSYGNAVWERRIDELYHSGGANNNTLCTIRNTIDLTQWSKICARVWFESAVNATYSAMWIHTYTNGFTNGFNSNSDTMTKGLPGEDGVVQKTPAETIIEYVIDPKKVNPATTFSIASWYVAKGHIYEIWLE